MKKKKRDYIEREFSDAEIEASVQEFRRGVQEEPDNNNEVFPNNVNDIADWIATLEEKAKHNPTDELKIDLRVYKAFRSGFNKAWQQAVEWFHKEADHVKQEEEIKSTMFDGGPMFKNEEEFQKMKESLAKDPDTPKGHWEEHGQVKQYIFDKPKRK
tara:strand:- start:65 stop:535 length:471 start_codon:yes stop_codon:yes gene_type:complete